MGTEASRRGVRRRTYFERKIAPRSEEIEKLGESDIMNEKNN